ncbi:MAG: response regulator transcription factor [Oscillospiraceae bacterium]|nr:response regulator transcription factor [Oscillospiraceae bacterium]
MRILVVDDEKIIVKGIKFNLESEGYEVETAHDGVAAIELLRNLQIDLVILDLMMPKMDGLEACKRIREFSNVPIIMLTAKGEDTDKILGLDYGADDYITKPFNIMELKSRVRAILRRTHNTGTGDSSTRLIAGNLILDTDQRAVFVDGVEVSLTAKEFDLMALLMRNESRVYSRNNLLNIVWGYEYPGDVRTVDVHIRRLREKLEAVPAEPQHIMTKWGVGYYFKA